MKRMKSIILFFAFIWLNVNVIGQATFSNNPETFLKQVDKYLSSSNRTKTKEFIEVFTPVWLNDFPSEYKS